jgi:hypothetical protein
MWQADSFDAATIRRELGWAAGLGFNTVRVYLHDLLWEHDRAGFRERIGRFLEIADGLGIRALFVLFDDCWNDDFRLGPQPAPRPGIHNSGWVRSPGSAVVTDRSGWPRLERYVKEVLSAFGGDRRVLLWDLYNEPGNSKMGGRSLPLLTAAFAWARAAGPSQPLTSGVWETGNRALGQVIADFQLAASDVITFHNYQSLEVVEAQIADLKRHGRPVICTEWLARGQKSRFQTHLPVFRRERVGGLNWGLVSGRTQTIYPWTSTAGAPEPAEWHHDILRADGTPFDPAEVECIRAATAAGG